MGLSTSLGNDPGTEDCDRILDPSAGNTAEYVEGKPHVQALERTPGGQPLKPWPSSTMTHACAPHGMTRLFAALDVLPGAVVGACLDRPRHEDLPGFSCQIDRETDDGWQLWMGCSAQAALHSEPIQPHAPGKKSG